MRGGSGAKGTGSPSSASLQAPEFSGFLAFSNSESGDGATGRSFAQERLTRLETFLKADLAPALEATIEHFAHRTLFRTADKVRRVREELASGVLPCSENAGG
jgi:hypothetical protein